MTCAPTGTDPNPCVHTPPATDTDHCRHPWLDQLCSHLAAIAVGQAAQQVLKTVDLPKAGAVVVLPTWSWAYPRVDIGRKSMRYDKTPLRLPIRLSYSCGPVLVTEGQELEVTWHGTGLGRAETGHITVGATGVPAHELPDWDDALPGQVAAHTEPAASLHVRLAQLVQAGEAARWELTMSLEEKYIRREMHNSAARVVAEVTDGASVGLDETTLDTITTRFVYGDPDQEKISPLARLLQHALVPSQFTKVDPGRWLTVALRRDTERFIRQYLDDVPNVGPKIRRMARELGVESLDDLVAAYRERHPGDRVARGRAASALSTTVDQLLVGPPLDLAFDYDDYDQEHAS